MRKFIFSNNQVVTKEAGKPDIVRQVDGEQRLYSLLELKDFDDKTRRFKGIATTIAPDHSEDIVEPKGAEYKMPVPFLYQHDSRKPIGWIDKARVLSDRIEVEGYIETPDADAPETIVERLNTAWYELKKKMVRGLSIGFNPKEWSYIKETGGIHWLKWAWLELSMVTIAANAEASITAIKSAASGQFNRPRQGNPNPKGTTVKYTAEALAALQKDRETKAARMAELKELTKSEGRRFTDDERTEFDALDAEIEDLDDEIRVTRRHVTNISKATPVEQERHGGAPHIKKFKDVEPKFKGEEGLKRAVSHIISMKELKQGNIVTPVQVFERLFGKSNPTMGMIMKAAVTGAGTDSGEWGAELLGVDNRYTGDFIEYLYGLTIYDRLPLREVPANVAIKGQDGAFTGYFVGQSKAIKVSKGDFSTTSTTPYKAAGLTVVSNEWLEDIAAGLGLVGEGLRQAIAQAVDSLFLSATAVSNGVSPAGILNGVSAINTNGGDAQSIATDIKALFAPFISAKNTSGGFAWVTTPTTALALSLMKNALGQPEYPTVTPNGGTFQGFPLYTGDNVGAGDLILIKPSDVWRIGDTGTTLSISDSAMIEQDDSPTGATDTPTAASATMVSMFQEDSTAIKVVRRVSWGKRRSGAVQYVGDAAYGNEVSA
jgi:HK97 family phage prohead protease